jgi:hypothetical protein
MSLAPLMRVFWNPEKVTEAMTNTGTVMTLPSTITKDMAREIVDAIPLDEVIHDLAASAARSVGTQLQHRGLRPADYRELRDIPDVVVERIIDALAKKPEKFFDTFAEHLKMQG